MHLAEHVGSGGVTAIMHFDNAFGVAVIVLSGVMSSLSCGSSEWTLVHVLRR
jgi:Fe-S cluster biogenesis protein NfuA